MGFRDSRYVQASVSYSSFFSIESAGIDVIRTLAGSTFGKGQSERQSMRKARWGR